MLGDLGITVLREIPQQFVSGISSGLYTTHGGVIRDGAGRILAHLTFPGAATPLQLVPGLNLIPELIQSYQLMKIGDDVKQVLSLSMANTAISGLGLATSLVGFAYLSRKLEHIDARIAEIKSWLVSASEGQLRAAIADFGHASKTTDPQTARHLLMSAKTAFTSLAHHYRSQAAAATKLADVQVYEDCAVIAMLGSAMATSELGLHEAARDDIREFHAQWSGMAREQCTRLLDLGEPAKLMDGRYAKSLPAAELVALLDFARKERRGIGWIDDLRASYGRTAALTPRWSIDDSVIGYARKLKARDDVLSGQVEHFAYLAARRISASQFGHAVERLNLDTPALILTDASTQVP